MADKIKVTAGVGRTLPVDPSVATAPGAQRLFLTHGTVIDVDPASTFVHRAMLDGDLVRASTEQIAAAQKLEDDELARATKFLDDQKAEAERLANPPVDPAKADDKPAKAARAAKES